MTLATDTVEFVLYPRVFRTYDNPREYCAAYCPRCRMDYKVFADSASDADEGFSTATAGNFPSHSSDECFSYLGETVRELKNELKNIRDEINELRE